MNATYSTGRGGTEGGPGWMMFRRVHDDSQSRTMVVAAERAIVEWLRFRLLEPMQGNVLSSVVLIACSIQAFAAFVE